MGVKVCDPDVLLLPSRRYRGARLHQQNWMTAKAKIRFLELKIPHKHTFQSDACLNTHGKSCFKKIPNSSVFLVMVRDFMYDLFYHFVK